DVETVVAAFAVQQRDELVQAGGAAARTGEAKTPRGAIENIAVAHEDAERSTARRLFGDAEAGFFDVGGTAIWTKEHADAKCFTGSSFASLEPGALDRKKPPAGDAFEAERDVCNLGELEAVGEQARKNTLHGEGDGEPVGREGITGSEGVFDSYG